MRYLAAAFVLVIALLQYPLWWGKGGWLKVWEYEAQLASLKSDTSQKQLRNQGLDAEVKDLKQGYDAIEERARIELGMIRQNELFIQLPEAMAARVIAPANPAAAPAVAPNKESKP